MFGPMWFWRTSIPAIWMRCSGNCKRQGHKLRSASILLQFTEPAICRGVTVQALPYPGFATDLQAVFGALLTQAQGMSIIHERVYDNRLLYVGELRKMGASIVVAGQTAIINGPTPLAGTAVRALDIRSGAALVLSGLAAEGTTDVNDVYHLDRGYEHFSEKLQAIGAQIQSILDWRADRLRAA